MSAKIQRHHPKASKVWPQSLPIDQVAIGTVDEHDPCASTAVIHYSNATGQRLDLHAYFVEGNHEGPQLGGASGDGIMSSGQPTA